MKIKLVAAYILSIKCQLTELLNNCQSNVTVGVLLLKASVTLTGSRGA